MDDNELAALFPRSRASMERPARRPPAASAETRALFPGSIAHMEAEAGVPPHAQPGEEVPDAEVKAFVDKAKAKDPRWVNVLKRAGRMAEAEESGK